MKWKCRYCNKEVLENIANHREYNELNQRIHIHFCNEECKSKYLKEQEEKRFCCYCSKHYQTEKIAREHEKSCILNPDNVKICPRCNREHTKEGIYCSRECANVREHSEETKQKISNSIRKHHRSINNFVCKDYKYSCLNCNKEFIPKKEKQKFCCLKCSKHWFYNNIVNGEENRKRVSDRNKILYQQDIITGWMIRHKSYHSYAEKFWIKVLGNNNIFYFNEFIVKTNYNKPAWYSIDFALVKNGKKIDLEIDGRQHKYKERKESDKKRDIFLTSKNWIVYRVEWNEINTNKGKELMKQKIDDFLKFYESL